MRFWDILVEISTLSRKLEKGEKDVYDHGFLAIYHCDTENNLCSCVYRWRDMIPYLRN